MPSGLWHFALSVGVCSLVDNNNNKWYFRVITSKRLGNTVLERKILNSFYYQLIELFHRTMEKEKDKKSS